MKYSLSVRTSIAWIVLNLSASIGAADGHGPDARRYSVAGVAATVILGIRLAQIQVAEVRAAACMVVRVKRSNTVDCGGIVFAQRRRRYPCRHASRPSAPRIELVACQRECARGRRWPAGSM